MVLRLAMVGDFTRESLCLVADTSLPAARLIRELKAVIAVLGLPPAAAMRVRQRTGVRQPGDGCWAEKDEIYNLASTCWKLKAPNYGEGSNGSSAARMPISLNDEPVESPVTFRTTRSCTLSAGMET